MGLSPSHSFPRGAEVRSNVIIILVLLPLLPLLHPFANPLGQTSCARGAIALAWTFALPNASPPRQPPPPYSSLWSQRCQILPPPNAHIAAVTHATVWHVNIALNPIPAAFRFAAATATADVSGWDGLSGCSNLNCEGLAYITILWTDFSAAS